MDRNSGGELELTVEQDVRPCAHMEAAVNSFADGSLRGPMLWYTRFHAAHCKECGSAIRNLRVVIDKVSDLRNETENGSGPKRLANPRRAELERALDQLDDESGDGQ